MTTIFKFHYYPTKGYTCSHPGDNTGYYVSLNDYERLQSANDTTEALEEAGRVKIFYGSFIPCYHIGCASGDPCPVCGRIGARGCVEVDRPAQPIVTARSEWPGEGW